MTGGVCQWWDAWTALTDADRAPRSLSVQLRASNHAGSWLVREGECGELDGRRQ
jgi:hypothetical protein